MQRIAAIVIATWQLLVATATADAPRPNIVVIITDDQGYGDLGHTGNPVIKTPHLDALAAESSSLTDYHVAPTCSPTRAALLTGHWTDRTGAWHTINGRSLLRENEVTLARMLADAGYATGHFGKWHLGDNFPYRPEDRGFTEVYRHGGGGVGQTPDVWDNSYFDGSYFHNGKVVPAKGFCTDVFFSQAQEFIRDHAKAKKPFFAYIATNAPHGPLHCPQKYMDLYEGQPPATAAFLGMITNIDDNIGATRALLRDLGVEDNTLFIFTTDNGTAGGEKVFNAGMRGQKGSEYDGGHRVPFIAHWPAAGWNKKHADGTLCHAVDIAPTLLDVTGAKKPASVTFDGMSIRRLLDPAADASDWPVDRMLVTDSQRVDDPKKWKQTAVMNGSWRLVNGTELYDIASDPGQKKNVADQHPDRVRAMTAFYDAWWADLEPSFAIPAEMHLGHPDHPVVSLTSHDWMRSASTPWNQRGIRMGEGYGPDRPDKQRKKSVHGGHWAVKALKDGPCTVSLRRWPAEADHPIAAGLPPGADVPGASKAFRANEGRAIPVVTAALRIDGKTVATAPVPAGATHVDFDCDLPEGSHKLAGVFMDDAGNEVGAYYAIITLR
jgi:arylsulfatase B